MKTLLPWLLAASTACRGACDVPQTASALAGAGAEACGEVPLDGDASAAWACAVAAHGEGRAFWLVWTTAGIDSVQVRAMASDVASLWELSQDQYGRGPYGIDGWDCLDAVVAPDAAGVDVIACGRTEPENNHYQVCGKICGPNQCQPQPLPFPGP